MDYIEVEQLRERLRIQRICQRAHIFGLAYRDIQAALKSNQFRRWGICQDYRWPSHFEGIRAFGTDTLTFSDEGGKMVLRLKCEV
ncbi:TPA: hypothetical protein MB364_000814 [Klebsiella variicola subsp. variicola]|nr:hypothetical protein [Klebsiella variicola subsp. variicola]